MRAARDYFADICHGLSLDGRLICGHHKLEEIILLTPVTNCTWMARLISPRILVDIIS